MTKFIPPFKPIYPPSLVIDTINGQGPGIYSPQIDYGVDPATMDVVFTFMNNNPPGGGPRTGIFTASVWDINEVSVEASKVRIPLTNLPFGEKHTDKITLPAPPAPSDFGEIIQYIVIVYYREEQFSKIKE